MKHATGQHKGALVLFCALAMAAFAMFTGMAVAETTNTSATLTAGDQTNTQALTVRTFAGAPNSPPQTLPARIYG